VKLFSDSFVALGPWVDATNVYWAGQLSVGSAYATVNKMPANGGTATSIGQVCANGVLPSAMALGGTSLYFTCDTTILATPLDGSGNKLLFTAPPPIKYRGIAVDAQNVYVATLNGPAVASVPLAGGAGTVVNSTTIPGTDAVPMAVDQANVYWGFAGGIYVAQKGAAASQQPYGPYSDHAKGFVAVGELLFFTDTPGVMMLNLAQLPPSASAPTMLAADMSAGALALDGNHVYYTGSAGVMKVPIAGGTPVLLAKSSGSALAVDAKSVYWVDGNGVLFKVAK
jgi:hypothetical protein